MGRRAQTTSAAPTAWLPGFEPAGFEAVHLETLQQQAAVAAPPPSPPTQVAVAAAIVAYAALPPAPAATQFSSFDLDVIGPEEGTASTDEPVEETSVQPREWPTFDLQQAVPPSGEVERVKENLAVIRLLKQLEAESRDPTQAERQQMLRYAGWGGMARIFEEGLSGALKTLREELNQVLSAEEYASARASTPNSHYTDPSVIDAIWGLIRHLGFAGGRIVEPTAGTGLFLAGMPAEIAAVSEVTAVELDSVSGAILKKAFGSLGVNVHVNALEKAHIPGDFYDLCVTNVPFGEFKSLDTRKVAYADFSIHNYVLCRGIELLRPGGIMVAITSKHSLDSQTGAHRRWLNAHAELLGAVRLPQGAFKRQANTDVVADLVVFKRRQRPLFSATAAWLELGKAPAGLFRAGQVLTQYSSHARTHLEVPRPLNNYFVDHPGMVIGQLELQSAQYGHQVVPVWDGNRAEFEAKLKDCLMSLPSNVYETASARPGNPLAGNSLSFNRVRATSRTRPGSFVLNKDRIHVSEGQEWLDVDEAFRGLGRERLIGLMAIRDAARAVLDHQACSDDEPALQRLQQTLNGVYDRFVKKHGNVSDRANVRVFRTDPECPLVLSLESYDEENEVFRKADIFTKRTVGKREAPATAENARDAMMISLAVHGRLSIADMARRLRIPGREVVQSLIDESLAYQDPEDGEWKPADEYLSGHIRNKIAAAKAAGARYQRNIAALTAVLPQDLGPAEVEVRLGAPWVPTEYLEQFIVELIKSKSPIEVKYDANSATWSVKATGRIEWNSDRMLCRGTWGTGERNAVELFEAALNQTPPKITRTIIDQTVVDKRATLAAREKYEAIRTEFKAWAYREDDRRDKLLRLYNDQFNVLRERVWDGSHLLLPGMSRVINPYKHQLDAIWRIVSAGNTLLDHIVGAGKTFTMAAACVELRRLGKAQKPCIVTPNHMLEQVTGDFVRFYPNANVLMASKEDLQGDKRREFVARIATGDWDAVIMTQSTFVRLPLRPETQARFVGEMLDQARLSMAAASESGSNRTVKQCEKFIKVMEAKVERALADTNKDDFIFWDDLGIDYVMYDESHAVKGLLRISKLPAIAGLSNASSNRAFDLWAKSVVLMEQRGCKQEGLVLSSATQITNSLAEMHVAQKLLQPYTLKAMGLYEFDAWAGTFGEAVQGMELAPDGSGYRLNTRFARFCNVADLMAIYRQVADIKTRSMIKLATPRIKGGKPQTISCNPSQALKDYTDELVERANAIRNGAVDPSKDNMLLVANCGRKAALDMRLINPTLPFDPDGKMAQVLANVVRIWGETKEKKGTQIIFCDLSTPGSAGFSFYDDLRARLIDAGIPAGEIEFIHDHDSDAAKAKLFRRMRAGAVRVLFGSTQKLGVGTNVQKRLKAIHHADPTWTPAGIEQRDGRAERPGNEWEEIELVRYVCAGSFDAYTWQLLTYKAKFIEQIKNSASGLRTVEDITMGALSYAEIKAIASGNPLVLEKATVDSEVMRYSTLHDQWEQDRWSWGRRKVVNTEMVASYRRRIDSVTSDARLIDAERVSGWQLKAKGGLCPAASEAASISEQVGRQILHASRTMPKTGECLVGTIGGMQLILSRYDGLDISLQSPSGLSTYRLDRFGVHITSCDATGSLVLQELEDLVNEPERLTERIAKLERENKDIEARLQMPFEHAEKLAQARKRQREIEASLDLDKDEAGAEGAAENAAPESVA